ncbi:phosphoribosylanthranilate isomerase, partial [Striga asiatica]
SFFTLETFTQRTFDFSNAFDRKVAGDIGNELIIGDGFNLGRERDWFGKGFNWSRFKLSPIRSKRERLFARGIKPENTEIVSSGICGADGIQKDESHGSMDEGCCLEMYTTTNLLQILFQFIRRQSQSKYRGTPLKIESPRINCVRRPSAGYGSSISPAVEGKAD